MKIDNLLQKLNIKGAEQLAQFQNNTQKVTDQKVREDAFSTDKVNISQTSRDIRKIQSVLKTVPDVRTDKVRQLKEQIEAGTYNVDNKKLANAMLVDLLKDLA